MGESTNARAKLRFDRRMRLEFYGAKLRERRTTILPRGRLLQGVALSSEHLHPINGGDDNEDVQRVWFTTAIVLPIGQTAR